MKNRLTLNIFLLIVMTDIGESVAQLFLKKGLVKIGITSIDFNNIISFLSAGAASYFVWLGIFVYIINFFLWMAVLSRVDLSVAFPVGSTSYIFVPLLAVIFLGESVTGLRWAGIILIILGIHFVSKSTKVKGTTLNRC